MTPTEQRIAQIIVAELRCDLVTPENLADSCFLSELDCDSLDLVQFLMVCEEEFETEITDDEAERFAPNDLGTTRPLIELVALIEGKVARDRGIRLSGEVAG